MVQLNFTPEFEVFYMLFDRYLSIFSLTSLKQHMEYFNFRCKISWSLLYAHEYHKVAISSNKFQGFYFRK